MDAVQLDMFADDPQNRPRLLSAIGEGVKNDCGVYVENVMKFSEGKLTGTNVTIKLCAVGKNIVNYQKETKELLKLCRKVCDRIAKEVA